MPSGRTVIEQDPARGQDLIHEIKVADVSGQDGIPLLHRLEIDGRVVERGDFLSFRKPPQVEQQTSQNSGLQQNARSRRIKTMAWNRVDDLAQLSKDVGAAGMLRGQAPEIVTEFPHGNGTVLDPAGLQKRIKCRTGRSFEHVDIDRRVEQQGRPKPLSPIGKGQVCAGTAGERAGPRLGPEATQ